MTNLDLPLRLYLLIQHTYVTVEIINKRSNIKNNETNRNDQITLSYIIIISEDSRDVEDLVLLSQLLLYK